jgi:hypothetical protein
MGKLAAFFSCVPVKAEAKAAPAPALCENSRFNFARNFFSSCHDKG